MNFAFMVHIGQKIKKALNESKYSVTDFATKINKSRTVVYNIFERDTIDTGLLHKISKVLDHDFFSYYNENIGWVAKDEQANYIKKNDLLAILNEELQACKKQLAELEKKYELQEKINKLLEEKIKERYSKK